LRKTLSKIGISNLLNSAKSIAENWKEYNDFK
jgi:hypothetical protein